MRGRSGRAESWWWSMSDLEELRQMLEADPDPSGHVLLALDKLREMQEREPDWHRISSLRVGMLGWKPGDEWRVPG